MKLINKIKQKFVKQGKFKNGDKVVMKEIGCCGKASSCNNTPKGTKLVITTPYHSAVDSYNISLPNGVGTGWVYDYEIELDITTKEQLTKELREICLQLEDTRAKLEFLNAQGLDEFDSEEFKAYQVLKVLGIDDVKKAKEIVRLLK